MGSATVSEELFAWEGIAREMVFHQTLDHPLPWRIDQDWTHEVKASDGHVVAKCHTREQAEQIIALAIHIHASIAKSADDFGDGSLPTD